ncbi:MAG: S1 RNA-binding domain-containing protein [Chloroflexales bacterium]|nr:S1 RNA-binding domain-containing protein [Chloroflexales bacterium]
MTDQERSERAAEEELLDDLLNAADTSPTPAVTEPAGTAPESAAQADPEAQTETPVAKELATKETSEMVSPLPAEESSIAQDEIADRSSPLPAQPASSETSEAVMAVTDEVEAVSPEAAAVVTPVEPPIAEDAEATGASFTPVEDDEEGGRPRRLKDLEAGMELEGKVTSIALYGIFVDLGVGRDGLVHISEMSDTRIDSPSDIVQIGDVVAVRIKSIDPEARRISLTMRSQRERSRVRPKRAEVNTDVLSNLKVGDLVEGTITGLATFGAFADIGVGKDGLVHISELAEGRVEKPEDAVQVGESYTFKLLEADPEGNRISLSLRRAQRTQKLQQLEIGQILEGTVSGLATFGAFVDIGVGRDGLVHISELSDGRVGKVEDIVKVGDKINVRVLEVDPQSKRISLTMRLEERPPEEVEPITPSTNVVPRTGPAAAPRFAAVTAARDEERRDEGRREERRRGGGRGGRSSSSASQQPNFETYSTTDENDAEFEGDATLEDLLSKFGGVTSQRRDKDRRRREDDEDDEDDDSRYTRRQRDAIRRTLQQVGQDE